MIFGDGNGTSSDEEIKENELSRRRKNLLKSTRNTHTSHKLLFFQQMILILEINSRKMRKQHELCSSFLCVRTSETIIDDSILSATTVPARNH